MFYDFEGETLLRNTYFCEYHINNFLPIVKIIR